ncbi:MAG: hypothetical protein JST53_06245 [Actinobacteria bacterium]|nr:hypothetical protein [Actinomycetota bacterium]
MAHVLGHVIVAITPPGDLEADARKVAEQEHVRHERIATVIESTELREF